MHRGAHADETGGELIEVGLADDNGASRTRRAPTSHRAPANIEGGQRRWWAIPATSILSFTATGMP